MNEFMRSNPPESLQKPMCGPTNPIRTELTDGSEVEVPVQAEQPNISVTEVGEVICPACGKKCKSDFGLKAHMRSHKE